MKRTVLWLAIVTLVATISTVVAQPAFQRNPVNPPVVLSGNDLGFQVTAREGSTPVGTLVVRIDGQWVPVKEQMTPSRLSQ